MIISTGVHSAERIRIRIDGADKSLEEAVNNNLLAGGHTYEEVSSPLNPGHLVNEIWVSTDSGEMTLLNALVNEIPLKKTLFEGYEFEPIFGHYATEINLESLEKTPQDAINDGDIYCTSHASSACYTGDVYWYNLCEAREELKEDCPSSPQSCIDGACCASGSGNLCPSRNDLNTACIITRGTTSCSGECVGFVPKPEGTYCGKMTVYYPYKYSYSVYCDGTGRCDW